MRGITLRLARGARSNTCATSATGATDLPAAPFRSPENSLLRFPSVIPSLTEQPYANRVLVVLGRQPTESISGSRMPRLSGHACRPDCCHNPTDQRPAQSEIEDRHSTTLRMPAEDRGYGRKEIDQDRTQEETVPEFSAPARRRSKLDHKAKAPQDHSDHHKRPNPAPKVVLPALLKPRWLAAGIGEAWRFGSELNQDVLPTPMAGDVTARSDVQRGSASRAMDSLDLVQRCLSSSGCRPVAYLFHFPGATEWLPGKPHANRVLVVLGALRQKYKFWATWKAASAAF